MNDTVLPSKSQVIAAVYETILRPELIDRFCIPAQEWQDNTLSGFPQRGESTVQLAELRSHFSRALEILEQQWRQADCPALLAALLHSDLIHLGENTASGMGQWIVIDMECKPIRASTSLARQFAEAEVSMVAKDGPLFATLQMGLAARGALRTLIRGLSDGDTNWQEFLLLETFTPGKRLLCRPVNLGGDGAALGVMIEVIDAVWPASAQEMLTRVFGLETQDVTVLHDVMNGLGHEAMPSRSLVAIAAKVGAPGALELVRLVGFLLREHADDIAISEGGHLPTYFHLPDGQGGQTQCFRLGADTGQPVIFVHGMLDGIAGIQRLQPQLRNRGFRVYAPMRGGYGESDPVSSTSGILEACVEQIECLIDHENLQRPILLGHRSGVAFARAVALRLQGRIGGVIGVAPELPLQQTRDLGNLQGHQKALALSARYLPSLVPVLLRSWGRSVRRRGAGTLIRRQAKSGSRALTEINALKLDPVLSLSHALLMQQDGAGFRAELSLPSLDNWLNAQGGETPTVYLCGEEEASLPQEGLYPAPKGKERFQMRICAEAGNVLLYVRPELVLSTLEEMASEAWQEALRG